jgi:hypothetical protein
MFKNKLKYGQDFAVSMPQNCNNWLVKIALLSFSEEVVVDAGETQGVELVTMTTKEHIFLPCNSVQ